MHKIMQINWSPELWLIFASNIKMGKKTMIWWGIWRDSGHSLSEKKNLFWTFEDFKKTRRCFSNHCFCLQYRLPLTWHFCCCCCCFSHYSICHQQNMPCSKITFSPFWCWMWTLIEALARYLQDFKLCAAVTWLAFEYVHEWDGVPIKVTSQFLNLKWKRWGHLLYFEYTHKDNC